MDNIIEFIIGFLAGLIVWTYINTVIILWKIDKIIKDKAL